MNKPAINFEGWFVIMDCIMMHAFFILKGNSGGFLMIHSLKTLVKAGGM